MNDLIQILKTFSVHLQNETVLTYLPFAGVCAIAALIFLLRKTAAEKNPRTSCKTDGEVSKLKPEPAQADEISPEVKKDGDGKTEEKPPDKLRESLTKSRSGMLSRLGKIVSGGKLNEDMWEQFEELLLLADIGVSATVKIRERIEKRISLNGSGDYEKIRNALIKETVEILEKSAPGKSGANGNAVGKPEVFMVVGVNGTGKTTTVGKLAHLIRSRGKKVMLAAADTFRAAATEQLEVWARRSESGFVSGNPGADPSGVAFDAVKAGAAENCDTVIIDTAGRLHTKTNLMDELAKIKRVIGKAHEGAPHEVFLVLDATTGQNAIRQTQMFDEAVGVTGIVLTKLDGTAKGGVLIAIAEQFEIPVRYVGTGEGIGDIAEFDPAHFASALFDETE